MQTPFPFLWFNGALHSADQPILKANDLGLLRAYAIFDYCLVIDGVPLFVEDHLERFQNSCRAMHLDTGMSDADIMKVITLLMERNSVSLAGLRWMATGGYASNGYLPESNPNVLFSLHPFPKLHPDYYNSGAKLLTYEYVRDVAEIKTTNYQIGILERKLLEKEGALDLLFVNKGYVSEVVRSNIFIINQNGDIITPHRDILKGITHCFSMMYSRMPNE